MQKSSWRDEDLADLPSRPHGKDVMSPFDDEAEAQPPKKRKVAGTGDEAAKKHKASARSTLSLEAEKRKNLILIEDDTDDANKVSVIK